MADVIKTTVTANYTFVLKHDDEENNETRTVSFDLNVNEMDATTAQKALAFRKYMLDNNLLTFIQPNGWRDDDDEETVWTTSAIKVALVERKERILDTGDND